MEHFEDDAEVAMRDPILFGDFRMALHEEETRIYEDIQDYEAAKALFQVWTGLPSGAPSSRERFSGEPSIARVEHCAPRRWSWEECPSLCLQVRNEGLCPMQGFAHLVVHRNDLGDLLNAQTPGPTPLRRPSSHPCRVPGVPIHSQVWEPLI